MTRRTVLGLAGGMLLVVAAAWLAAGYERVDPAADLAVVDCLDGALVRRIVGSRALAPAALCRLARYPRRPTRVALPDAARARLAAADGGGWGLLGWAVVEPQPEGWRALHRAAGREGLEGVLVAALADAAPAIRVERRGPQRRALGPIETDRLDAELRRTLAARGLALVGLEVDSVDFLVAADRDVSRGSAGETRVLLIGLDGADWALLDPLIAAGRMPTLAGLIERGARGRLLSISPMLSPVIWTSIATGVEPTTHGVLDFLVAGPDGAPQPVTSAQRRVPALWEMLSDAGVDVGVVGWWATWPADPVRGYLVSDRLAYQLFGYRADPDDAEGKTWPPGLYGRLRELVVDPRSIARSSVDPFLVTRGGATEQGDSVTTGLLDEFRTLLASEESYMNVALRLSREFEPRFETVYLEGTDTVGHLFMRFRPPPLAGVELRRAALLGEVVDRYYERVDRQLARLLEGRGPEWTVMIVSDHGFATDTTRPQSADSRIGHGAAAEWHRRFGVIVASGAGIRRGVRIEEASVYDIAPTVLALFGRPIPRGWPGRVLSQAIDPGRFADHPLTYDDRPLSERRDRGRQAQDDPNAADLMAKLESLGYVSAGGAGAAVTAVNNAAVALMGQARYAEAEAEFRRGFAANPTSSMLEMNLGLCLTLQGRAGEAAGRFEAVLEREPDGPAGRVAAVQLARIRFEAGALDDADTLLARVLAREPGAADALSLRGELAEARGDVDAAERDWRRAAELDPDAVAARNHLGTSFRSRGDLGRAEHWYLAAIESDPYFMGAYNNLALVYQATGRVDQAIDLYGRALGKAPEHPTVLNNLASLRYQTGRIERAVELWRRASQADPSYASPLNNLGGIAFAEGRLGEAAELLDRAIALEPAYGDARLNRALVHLALGEPDAAREALRVAVADPASAARALFELGALELQADRPLDAVRALGALIDRDPENVDALNTLGEALRRAGRSDDAAAVWRRSLELRADQPAVRRRLDRP